MDERLLPDILKNDYTYRFSFRKVREIPDPQRDTLLRIKSRYYFGTKAFTRKKIKTYDLPHLKKHGVQIVCYRDALFHRSLALKRDIPVFDSGDRQYDSLHTLYLIHSLTDVSAVYCKEGYEISEMYLLETMTAVSEELLQIMKDNRFPVFNIKLL